MSLEFGSNARTAGTLFFGDNQRTAGGAVVGSVTLSLVPSAGLVVERYYSTTTWTTAFINPAATQMAYRHSVGSISGAATVSLSVAATLAFVGERQRQLSGVVSVSITPNADLAYRRTVQRNDLIGEATLSIVPSAELTIDLKAHSNLLGSLTLEITPNARLANSARWAFEEPADEIEWTFEAGA